MKLITWKGCPFTYLKSLLKWPISHRQSRCVMMGAFKFLEFSDFLWQRVPNLNENPLLELHVFDAGLDTCHAGDEEITLSRSRGQLEIIRCKFLLLKSEPTLSKKRFFHLNETGTMDEETKASMKLPRCGRADLHRNKRQRYIQAISSLGKP